MKLSVREERTWISHGDVNLKMRKKRVMVPLGSDGLLHCFRGKKQVNQMFTISAQIWEFHSFLVYIFFVASVKDEKPDSMFISPHNICKIREIFRHDEVFNERKNRIHKEGRYLGSFDHWLNIIALSLLGNFIRSRRGEN